MDHLVHSVDHLVFAAPELSEGVSAVEERLGVKTEPGGRHEGLGTRNRLIGLGDRSYLEVVAVDPRQPDPQRPRWFALDELDRPRLVTWCVAADHLDAAGALDAVLLRARAAGLDLGEAVSGSRERPDGSRLAWTFSDPWADRAGGVVPFVIDWGETRHPGSDLEPVCRLHEVRVEHPEPETVRRWLRALGVDTPVTPGPEPRVVAILDTPRGRVELR